ncbi:hypothetical protein FHR24_003117 [Wenyingzhuangia heitensis]|uniref:Secreted protein n=1 Tax=Wenyingzhuangia heitensis TaxID=1487859 RepID=A0ABX0UHY1_9FLAO|nr:hypothetical protein [Wenyingzhuangia heitensis]NIJ46622.1 hypothetical protein [Wenyingzhuangia heitensis]
MKKLIGILSIAVFAFALSFNTSVITDSNISLAELVNINNANAEDPFGDIPCSWCEEEQEYGEYPEFRTAWGVPGYYIYCHFTMENSSC